MPIRAHRFPLILVLGVLIAGAPRAFAATLLFEDFESLPMQSYVSPTETPSGTGADWSSQLPPAWQATFSGPVGNPIEFRGWRVHRVDSWITTEQDQSRSTWSNGSVGSGGNALLVDPDAYDDGTDIDVGRFNAWVTTPPIDLTGITANSVSVAFDSFWRNEVTQIGSFDVSYDGGNSFQNLLTYDSAALPNGGLIDQRESFELANPSSGDLVLRFGMTQASNDWWWAIDNLEIATEPKLRLVVDRDTRQMTLLGDASEPLQLQGYSILSAEGALQSDVWRSVAETGDADSGGSFDPQRRWVRFTAAGSRNDLSEGVLGITTIATDAVHALGPAWIPFWQENLAFTYVDENDLEQVGSVEFVGNGGQPFQLGDLTFDGNLNAQDWLQFLSGLGGEFPDRSVAEAYALGDLNGDLETNREDFVLFQTQYDSVNGPGAFQQMLENVPEPATGFWLVSAMVLWARRRRSIVVGLALLGGSVLAVLAPPVHAQQVLLIEDFEGLGLVDSDLASDGAGETDWTNVGPSGWSMDARDTPNNVDRPEFQGWTYLDSAFWIAQQGAQVGRDQFLPNLSPNNTIAVVDPDAHADFAPNDPDQFSAVLRSPTVSLEGVAPASVEVSFDSSWVPEDRQEAQFNVVIDGVRTNLFTWDSEANANFKAAATNERVVLPIVNPEGAEQLFFEWDMVEAGNDWWWAVDNVRVESTGQSHFLELVIDRRTGATSIENQTGDPIPLNYYEIQSPSGSLVAADFPIGWDSLDDQNFDALGSGPGQSWDEGQRSDATELVEAFLLGQSVLADAQVVSIGRAYDATIDTGDVCFYYAADDGPLIQGLVRYREGPSGDFNADGTYDCTDIDALVAAIATGSTDAAFDLNADRLLDTQDLAAWLAEAGAAVLPSGNPFLFGDANLDGVVDVADFNVWNASKFEATAAWCRGDFNADGVVDVGDFNIWNAEKFNSALRSVVPEPQLQVWGPVGGLLVLIGKQRRWPRTSGS